MPRSVSGCGAARLIGMRPRSPGGYGGIRSDDEALRPDAVVNGCRSCRQGKGRPYRWPEQDRTPSGAMARS